MNASARAAPGAGCQSRCAARAPWCKHRVEIPVFCCLGPTSWGSCAHSLPAGRKRLEPAQTRATALGHLLRRKKPALGLVDYLGYLRLCRAFKGLVFTPAEHVPLVAEEALRQYKINAADE